MAPDSSYTLAAVLATADMQRLYSGLSLLVSAAVDGEACAALATFRSLELIVDPGLGRLAADPEATPGLAWQGREKFARSLAELRDTALSLDSLSVFGCSASGLGLSASGLGFSAPGFGFSASGVDLSPSSETSTACADVFPTSSIRISTFSPTCAAAPATVIT